MNIHQPLTDFSNTRAYWAQADTVPGTCILLVVTEHYVTLTRRPSRHR